MSTRRPRATRFAALSLLSLALAATAAADPPARGARAAGSTLLLHDAYDPPIESDRPPPDALNEADGAMLEPLGVALHACGLAHITPGDAVGVFGAGPIGWLTVQAARLLGARMVYATDLPARRHRLDAAQSAGAIPIEADGNEAGAIRRANGGRGLDVSIEMAGDNAAVDAAVEAVRPGSRVVLGGIPASPRTSIVAATARRKGLTLAWVRRMKHTYPRAIDLVARGLIDVRSGVTGSFRLDAAREAFESAARREGMKTVVRPAP
jgi:L-iditol 2-dehydrogenase